MEVSATMQSVQWAHEGHSRTMPMGTAAPGRVRVRSSSVALKKWLKTQLDVVSCPSWEMSPCFTSKHEPATAQGDTKGLRSSEGTLFLAPVKGWCHGPGEAGGWEKEQES